MRFVPVILAVLLCAELPASAEPRPRASGFYAEADFGARGFLGQAADYSAMGPIASVHLGYDLFSWLSIGGQLSASTHEATVPPPPEGELYQLYGGGGEARISVPIGPMAIFADGAIGLSLISTDVLVKVMVLDPGEELTPFFSAGGGLEYQLQNRHYALGVAGDWTLLPKFDATQAVSGRAYLRYTY